MLRQIFAFELRYHLRSPLFYIFFLALGFMTFLVITSDAVRVGGGIGNVNRNAPVVILQLLGIMSVIGVFVTTAFSASAAQRDFETGTAELFFSKPMKKTDYLLGRFLGSLVVSLLVFLGPALGIAIGAMMPWLEPERIGPFQLAPYLFALLVMVLPNLIMTGATFFSLAAWSRSLMFTYLGVVVFFVGFQIAGVMLMDVENLELASYADPFGIAASQIATRYWTVAEQNSAVPALTGTLLGNRLLWTAVGLAILAFGIWRFRFERSAGRSWWRRGKKAAVAPKAAPAPLGAGQSFSPRQPRWGGATTFSQFLRATRFEVGQVFRSVPFVIILAFGALNVFGAVMFGNEMFGTQVHPVTHLMLDAIRGSFLFLLVIIVTFYGGELVFRERTARLSDVTDALPTPNGVFAASKLVALLLVILSALVVAMSVTIVYQLTHGYSRLQLGLYAQGLLLDAWPFLLIACLAVFLQVIANNKFIGYLLMIVYMLSDEIVLDALDLEHNLYHYAGGPPTPYSDMNGFGHFLTGALAFGFYWTFGAAILVALSVLFWVRGRDTRWSFRRALAKTRLRGATRAALIVASLGFLATGAWAYYNTSVVNTYLPGDAVEERQADYEKKYRQYRDLIQPRVVAVRTDVDIFPAERRLAARGTITFRNKTDQPQKELHYNLDPQVKLLELKLPPHQVKLDDPELGYHIVEFTPPIAPGESFDLEFAVAYGQQGFVNGRAETRLVENGTFFNNGDFFPTFGYEENRELKDRGDRRKYELPPVPRWPKPDDLAARRNNYVSRDADWVDFETTVSTSSDQIVIAPGYLQKEWEENGRRYYHYKMDSPIFHFYAYLSARYKVLKDEYQGVAIEIYYDPQHEYNVGRMVDGIKKSLEYFSREFGPYQHRQMRILEFPQYARFAQAFPNTVPFSESIGFIARIDDAKDIDYVFYVTAHEVAHQWWAHQVIGGAVQGATMLSETFSQYSALMVMEKEYGKEKMRRFLKFELDRYLQDRGGELVEEMPLAFVENQGYIHYRKGSLILYALRDYLGEETVNRALRKFRDKTAFQEPPYTTSLEFLDILRQEAGPEAQSLIDDLFLKITLLETRVDSVTYKKNPDGTYKVRIEANLKKLYADGGGQETEAPLDAWLDVGIFGEEEKNGVMEEKVLFLEKRRVASGSFVFEADVPELPVRAGVDPYNKWVDRDSNDNVRRAEENAS